MAKILRRLVMAACVCAAGCGDDSRGTTAPHSRAGVQSSAVVVRGEGDEGSLRTRLDGLQEVLASIDDPDAIMALYRVFSARHDTSAHPEICRACELVNDAGECCLGRLADIGGATAARHLVSMRKVGRWDAGRGLMIGTLITRLGRVALSELKSVDPSEYPWVGDYISAIERGEVLGH